MSHLTTILGMSQFDPLRKTTICALLIAIANFAIGAGSLRAQQPEKSETEIVIPEGLPLPKFIPDLKSVSRAIVQLSNKLREREGFPPLAANPELTATADYYSAFMGTHDKYGHEADGKRPSERAKDHGYDFCIVLENVAYQYRETPFEPAELARIFVESWENSPEHRKNMLDPDVKQIGVSVGYSKKTGHFFAVQMFGRHRSDVLRFQLANRSGEAVHYKLGNKNHTLQPRYTRTHELCRSSKLEFLGTDEKAKQPLSVVTPQQGDFFVVTNDDDRVSLQRETAEPP